MRSSAARNREPLNAEYPCGNSEPRPSKTNGRLVLQLAKQPHYGNVEVRVGPLISELLLDTNAVSDLAESEQAIMTLPAGVERWALPVIVVGEYRLGIAHARDACDDHRWLERLITESRVRDITDESTRHYASIRTQLRQMGKTISVNDVWIAALGGQHDPPIRSRDQHFEVVPGIERLNW
jgi:tRNA(fMet)-specific endonuclease VapC